MTETFDDNAKRDLYRPFRPQASRWVALILAVAVAVFMTALALLLPGVRPMSLADVVGIVAFGWGAAWFLLRHATVRATPSAEGLVVRNLLLTRTVDWAEIVSVRFGQGRPWVQLDLADGEVLAVMGIQASDGARGTVEASRLATLVALHTVSE